MAQTPAKEPSPPSGPACEACGTPSAVDARFCKRCGSSVAPPPSCPACSAAVPTDARFCASCGVRLIGARPSALDAAPPSAPRPEPAGIAPLEPVAVLGAPPRSKPSSGIGANVLLFVAILCVLLVAIYEMNKDAPKEISPFEGGPPPSAPMARSTSPAPAAQGPSLRVTVSLDPAHAEGADGTLFVILRPAGSPNQGPPVAVKKLDRPSFPAEVELGPADVMMPGVPLTGPFDVYARLDRDGNAMTKGAGDLVSARPTTGATPGGEPVRVALDERLGG